MFYGIQTDVLILKLLMKQDKMKAHVIVNAIHLAKANGGVQHRFTMQRM